MEVGRGNESRTQDVLHPLSHEAEVRAALAAAEVSTGGEWGAVRTLASRARSTLQAGRGALALSLITAALKLAPQPFRQLASLEQLASGGTGAQACLTVAKEVVLREIDKVTANLMSTALIVWHGAVTRTASSSSCPQSFLCFSHCIACTLSLLAGKGSVHQDLQACWLYNMLAFAHRCKATEGVACYLLGQTQGEAKLPEDLRGNDTSQLHFSTPSERNVVREFIYGGLQESRTAAMFNRICTGLYAEGCTKLHLAQNEMHRRASALTDILRRGFSHETLLYTVDFRRPMCMEPQDINLLCQSTMSEDILTVPREVFGPIRLACLLRGIIARAVRSPVGECKLASLSSVVALALRHQYIDIAAEIVRSCVELVDPADASLLLWGADLESTLKRDASTSVRVGTKCLVAMRRKAEERQCSRPLQMHSPNLLLHEAVQQSCSEKEVLRDLVLADEFTHLLPAGLAILRGCDSFRQRLLADKIALPLILSSLSRLIVQLVDEGDAPLARCFMPLVANLCVAAPSRSHFILTLQALAAFAKCCASNIEEWDLVASTLSPFAPPSPMGANRAYHSTKSNTVGRSFLSRRQVYDPLFPHEERQTAVPNCYCQVQITLAREGEGVRLCRFTNAKPENVLQWEKVLPIQEQLLQLVDEMKDIERQNRTHLRSAEEGATPALEEISAPSTPMSLSPPAAGGIMCATGDEARKAREGWWDRRRALNDAIGVVVQSMQSDRAFGCWRLAMCGDLPDTCRAAVHNASDALLQALNIHTQYQGDIFLLLSGLPFMGSHSLTSSKIMFNPPHLDSSNPCSSCKEMLSELAGALGRELCDYVVGKSMDIILEASRLATTQVLDAMATTLLDQQNGVAISYPRDNGEHQLNENFHVNLLDIPRTTVYLVLDNELHVLPFEGVDVLRHGCVARVPTKSFVPTFTSIADDRCCVGDSGDPVTGEGDGDVHCSTGSVYCVIDPLGVMSKTSGMLLPLCTQAGWCVKSHNAPPPASLLRDLYEMDTRLYLYAGHGRGEDLLHRGELYDRLPDPFRFPAVLLMGCSSAHMDGGATYDCYGMPYAFLHAGAPLFVGCLWHVTDGEIDRLTRRLLLLISGGSCGGCKGAVRRPVTIAEALRLARRSCKLPFLTGCATVLYGVDLPLRRNMKENGVATGAPR
uniref:separase n=1 Tax=Trypanosoma congolense (strain IL3000) TaxID=1068625 RepID=G0UJ32_TRYCI|nr:putative separase [Trypanosoma congolense IL3000]